MAPQRALSSDGRRSLPFSPNERCANEALACRKIQERAESGRGPTPPENWKFLWRPVEAPTVKGLETDLFRKVLQSLSAEYVQVYRRFEIRPGVRVKTGKEGISVAGLEQEDSVRLQDAVDFSKGSLGGEQVLENLDCSHHIERCLRKGRFL